MQLSGAVVSWRRRVEEAVELCILVIFRVFKQAALAFLYLQMGGASTIAVYAGRLQPSIWCCLAVQVGIFSVRPITEQCESVQAYCTAELCAG